MPEKQDESQAIAQSNKYIYSGAKNARTLSKSIKKVGEKIPLKVKLIALGVVASLLLIYVIVSGASSSQLDDVYHLTPNGEEEINLPKEEEREQSLNDRDYARQATQNLLDIINDFKEEDWNAQIHEIQNTCKRNGWDIERTLNLLTDDYETVSGESDYTSQDGRVLAAFSVSIDNGEILKTGPLSYINQVGIPVKTYIFGEKAGEINYEKSLKEELKAFLKSNKHFYELLYEMQDGQIKVFVDVEIVYVDVKVPVLDSNGNDTGTTETKSVPTKVYYYYVHPILTERDTNAMAEEIFSIDINAPYINSGYETSIVGEDGVISNREAINRIAEITQALLFDVSVSSDAYYFSSFEGQYEWPAPGNTTVTSTWGMRYHPITHKYSIHSGVDISGVQGSPVVAAEDGEVIFAGYSGSYGNLIKIKHGDGNITYYAHLSAFAVSAGTEVERGQQIGLIGNTGQSTGPHLHFEVRLDGTSVDPLPWIVDSELYCMLLFL